MCFQPSHLQKSVSQWFALCHSMDRFVSKRSSSSVDLDSSSSDEVRAERAAIALSVGLSWPPDRCTKQTRGPTQLAAALGTPSSGPHPRPPRASAWCPFAAPGLVATRRSHRPAAHTRGARHHQDSPCRHSRASTLNRRTR